MKAFLRALPLLILAPVLLAIGAAALALTDLFFLVAGRRRKPVNVTPKTSAASLVVPNWNGKDLLQRFLPSWLAAIANHPGSEVVVVDNGSTDGSAAWIRQNYPEVRLIALPENLGFGGGSNAGIEAAKNDIVVLLNSDMRVDPDFLPPLLAGFTDEKVFAVSCQIFLGDPAKRREETGLTHGLWRDGALWVSHTEDRAVDRLFPCFYGGGGSCAFDRRKFLELGGFDPLLAPFYLEDTDLGFLAWKRGWKVLYQPASVVHHEHRGTIGKHFDAAYIRSILQVFASERDASYFHPLADPAVVAGQGTIGLELFDALPEIDIVLVAIGDGALISGISVALKALKPAIRTIGIEPEGSPTLSASLAAKCVVSLPSVTTQVATMACGRTDERIFALVQELVDELVLISDADMLAAARWLWSEFGIAADLSGAAGVAALRSGKLVLPKGSRTYTLICGAGQDGIASVSPASLGLDRVRRSRQC